MSAAAIPDRGRKPRRAPAPSNDGWREFITPEGVDLRLRIASYVERAAALALDLSIIAAALVVFTILAVIAALALHFRLVTQVIAVAWLLGFFLLRNFYFTGLEMRPGGATPGKRMLGIRVVARNGGRLTTDAVFVRNALREVELYLPLTFLMSRGQGIDAGLIALGAIWSGVFVIFPLFNRDRLRLGDLAAGTMVVRAPKRVLMPDMAQDAVVIGRPLFSETQLDAYGIKELQVLEQVLRAADRGSMAEVARRIRAKIGWDAPLDVSDQAFLSAYYTGLRARLENRLLFGHRRADKFDRP